MNMDVRCIISRFDDLEIVRLRDPPTAVLTEIAALSYRRHRGRSSECKILTENRGTGSGGVFANDIQHAAAAERTR